MDTGFITVAAATPKVQVGNVTHNARQIINLSTLADTKSVNVIVYPALSLTGASIGDLRYDTTLLNNALSALFEVAEETKELSLLQFIGLPLRYNGTVYDCTAAVKDGYVLAVIPNEQADIDECICVLDHEFHFGDSKIFVNCGNFTIGVNDYTADVCVMPTAQPQLVGLNERNRARLITASSEYACAIVAANAGDGESTTDNVYFGINYIAECGKIIAQGAPLTDELLITQIDLDYVKSEKVNCAATAVGEESYYNISLDGATTLTRKYSRTPFVPENAEQLADRCREILAIQAQGLVKRITHTRTKASVIGVSGGLDSCLALLALNNAYEQMGGDKKNIYAISMPCFGTTSRTKSNAQKLCEALDVTFNEIDITDSVRAHLKAINHDESNVNVTYENAQARERTQVLMDVANDLGGMVIGTGDLSEIALGWSTYNGDHMSMYSVNSSIPKTLVRALVSYVAATTADKKLTAVLNDILDTPVSPELLPSKDDKIVQKTEDSVGPYELNDFFVYHYVRRNATPTKLLAIAMHAFDGKYDRPTILKWLKTFFKRFFTQQFKRSCSPDGIKVGSVSLSPRGEYNIPSDVSYDDYLREIEELN